MKEKKRRILKRIILFLGAVAGGLVLLNLVFYFLVHTVFDYRTNSVKPVYHPEDTCSLFVYMCGSNLESEQGLGGKNINELLEAKVPDSMKIIIETGGARKWNSHNIAHDKLSRYEIRDHKLTLLETLDNASMGSADTFLDFLRWSNAKYRSDRNILVVWDHGNSLINGVCFDENYSNDSLDMKEMEYAFDRAGLRQKYDIVAFDTCYTASIEMVDIVKEHAHYMTASQRIVPAGGLDYCTLAESFPEHDDLSLGKIICDSYMEKYKKKDLDSQIQLSLFDTAGTDRLIEAVDKACLNLAIRQKTINGNFKIYHAAWEAVVDSTTANVNMTDLLDFMRESIHIDLLDHFDEVKLSLEAMVPYQVCGEMHYCNGVSVFYPVSSDKSMLENYLENCPMKEYAGLLKTIYSDIPEKPLVFTDRGGITDSGTFRVSLSEDSRQYLSVITYSLWEESRVIPGKYNLLGNDAIDTYSTSIEKFFANLTFESDFRGEWYALDDNFLLTSTISRMVSTVFSAPVNVNGMDTNFFFLRINSGANRTLMDYLIGDDIDEYGMPDKNRRELKAGDVVEVYSAVGEDGRRLLASDDLVISGEGPKVSLQDLPAGNYRYCFNATDIIGNTISSDYVIFQIAETGGERTIEAVEVVKNQT